MLKWGILGTSLISEIVAKAILNDSGSTIQAVAGRQMGVVNEFSVKYSIPSLYKCYYELINDPDVDVVYIGLPHHLHHHFILASIQANKHILYEKPLSIDIIESRQVTRVANNYKNLVIEGLMYLHHPIINKLVALIKSKAIGNICTVSGQYCSNIAWKANIAGKGAIYNLGSYPISLMQLVFQTAFGDDYLEGFSASARGVRSSKTGNIFSASMLMQLGNGVVGSIHVNETYGKYSSFEIVGDEGSLKFHSNPWGSTDLSTLILTTFSKKSERIDIFSSDDAFDYQVRNIRTAITKGNFIIARPAPRIYDSYEIMKLLTRWENICLDQLESTNHRY